MARNFTAGDDEIGCGGDSSVLFSGGDTIAFSVWVKTTNSDVTVFHTLLTRYDFNGGDQAVNFQLRINGTGNDRIEFAFTDSGGNFASYLSSEPITWNGWHHIAFSHEYQDSSKVEMYMDGSDVGSSWGGGGANKDDAPRTSPVADLTLGNWDNGTFTQGLVGDLGDVLLYKDPGITASGLAAMRYNPWQFRTGLVAGYRLGHPTAEPDLSGTGNNGTTITDTTITDHSPTSIPFSYVPLAPFAVGIAGPLVNSRSRLKTLVGGGLV